MGPHSFPAIGFPRFRKKSPDLNLSIRRKRRGAAKPFLSEGCRHDLEEAANQAAFISEATTRRAQNRVQTQGPALPTRQFAVE